MVGITIANTVAFGYGFKGVTNKLEFDAGNLDFWVGLFWGAFKILLPAYPAIRYVQVLIYRTTVAKE